MSKCKDCFNGCADPNLYDRCIKYTGADNTDLSICNGDQLDIVIDAIIAKIETTNDGSSIFPTVDTTCSFFSTIIGTQDKNLQNILQSLIDGECNLSAAIASVTTIVNSTYSFNTLCLTIPANPTRDDIIQAAITKICSIDTRVTNIEGDYVKSSNLNTLIQQYLDSIVTTTTQQSAKMVPFVAYEYYGPLTNFDASGKGLSSTGFDKVYICNGSNGTPDKRGRVAVGVNIGVPGGALDSSVDPAGSNNYQITLKGKLGEFKHTNTLLETAVHTHAVTQEPHTHGFPHQWNEDGAGHIASGGRIDEGVIVDSTLPSYVNLTIGSAGGGQPHNNTQPSIGANFIMHIP